MRADESIQGVDKAAEQSAADFALKWIRKGALAGDVEAMSLLGTAYYHGPGVEKNYQEAIRWLSRAAQQGNATAQLNLGVCFYHGHGVQQDFAEAGKWIRLSAEQGSASAQYHLGCLYSLGHGVPQDPGSGLDWFLEAAEQNEPTAQMNVGVIYLKGELLEQDLVEAYKWMRLAAIQGVEGAEEGSKEIVAEMTFAQRREGDRRIAEFNFRNVDQPPPDDSGLDGIIGRLARQGDAEAQVYLCLHKRPDGTPSFGRRTISSQVRREVWRRDGGSCARCGSRERLEFDHIIPVSKGGSNTARNIELLCEACNRRKSASIE